MIGVSGNQFTWNDRPVRLAGAHTWNTVQPMGAKDEITGLDQLAMPEPSAKVRPFTRLWTVETRGAVFAGSKWGSNTPGLVQIDNGPFGADGRLNPRFYQAMRRTVRQAERKDIVTGVVLFEGSIPDIFPGGWDKHPFKGRGPSWHDRVHTQGPWNRIQRQHVRRMTKVLEPFDNVMYEVGNELMATSTPWFQRWAVNLVKRFTDKPVGVSYARGIRASKGNNEANWMRTSGADWYGPTFTAIKQGQFKNAGKPILFDPDHSWALQPNVGGLREMWNLGHSVALMDGMRGTMLRNIGNMSADRAFIEDLS